MLKTTWTVMAVVVLSVVAVGFTAHAAGIIEAPYAGDYDDEVGFINLLQRAVNILFTILMIGAVIAILFAAFQYLTSGGNTEKVQQAGQMVLYAAVAVAIAVLARAVPNLVCGLMNVDCKADSSATTPAST